MISLGMTLPHGEARWAPRMSSIRISGHFSRAASALIKCDSTPKYSAIAQVRRVGSSGPRFSKNKAAHLLPAYRVTGFRLEPLIQFRRCTC